MDGDFIEKLRSKYALGEISKEELLSYAGAIPLDLLEAIILDCEPRLED